MSIQRREFIKQLCQSLGGIASASSIAAVLSACEKGNLGNAPVNSTLSWSPTFFSEHEAQTISTLSELILPATETPGAIDVGVPHFIEKIIAEVFSKDDRNLFQSNGFAFDLICTSLHENNFVSIDKMLQQSLAGNINKSITGGNTKFEKLLLEKKRVDKSAVDGANNYFKVVKQLTILGFFTSEIGATQVLHYNPIPGRYDGCAPLSDIGKTWATPR